MSGLRSKTTKLYLFPSERIRRCYYIDLNQLYPPFTLSLQDHYHIILPDGNFDLDQSIHVSHVLRFRGDLVFGAFLLLLIVALLHNSLP